MTSSTPQSLGRRSLMRGAAWAAPTAAVSLAAPAFAGSSPVVCDPAVIAEIDQAFTAAETLYTCAGQPVKLQINIYQPYGIGDGYATGAFVDVKNLSPCDINFTADNPLRIDVDIRNANVVTTGSENRDITGVYTSWGTLNGTGESENIAGQPVGSNQGTVEWLFAGLLPGNGLGDNEADLSVQFGDGITGLQRWQSYMTITPGTASGAPILRETWAVNEACVAYYNQKLTTWEDPFEWFVSGPKVVSSPAEVGRPWQSGQTFDTRNIGNWSSVTGDNSTNGIW
ncbi:hypothetical protein JSY14_04710 [Brachybacterium sp. EF45031]|uniref:hypothetical protein n=1 Tax=Brachybacterium sillae TaxID=2810536 RepID=UPI00217D8A1F|nr:hypothetical protein [Brachybacterium sillae]MCS6711352.1 hypothetical protein [Brachybacterium sillae]